MNCSSAAIGVPAKAASRRIGIFFVSSTTGSFCLIKPAHEIQLVPQCAETTSRRQDTRRQSGEVGEIATVGLAGKHCQSCICTGVGLSMPLSQRETATWLTLHRRANSTWVRGPRSARIFTAHSGFCGEVTTVSDLFLDIAPIRSYKSNTQLI